MTFKIEIDQRQLDIISEALAAMPYGRVFVLIAELQKQIAPQVKQIKTNGIDHSLQPAETSN